MIFDFSCIFLKISRDAERLARIPTRIVGTRTSSMKLKYIWPAILLCGVFISCTNVETVETGFNPGMAIVQFYRGPLDHLSAVRHGSCPMHPSCSEYSRQCFENYGPAAGWAMTCDRLMRCGRDELKLSGRIMVNGEWKSYDPVEMNVFP